MTVYRISFVGPATRAVGVATALADADGVDLISSKQPFTIDADTVDLEVTVAGTRQAVADAVSSIRAGMPKGSSIEIVDD